MASRLEVNWGKFDALKAKLGALKDGLNTPAGRRHIERVKEILKEDNRDALLRGLDRHGVRMAELAPSTLEGRDGSGPPLVPHDSASRLIKDFRPIDYRYSGQVVVRAQWDGDVSTWLGYHKRGAGRLPIRDVVGIRPAARQRIRDSFKQLQRDLIRDGGK